VAYLGFIRDSKTGYRCLAVRDSSNGRVLRWIGRRWTTSDYEKALKDFRIDPDVQRRRSSPRRRARGQG
jgi:hypothetical protein